MIGPLACADTCQLLLTVTLGLDASFHVRAVFLHLSINDIGTSGSCPVYCVPGLCPHSASGTHRLQTLPDVPSGTESPPCENP